MSQQTPEVNNNTAHAAAGNLAFLLSVIRCGETLSADEELNVRDVIARLSRLERVEGAASALVAQLDRVHADPQYKRVWEVAQAHQGQYDGLKYEQEMYALKAVVQPSI